MTEGRNGNANFHGQKRSNATHASTTDAQARLYRKEPGEEAKLCVVGGMLMENGNGLIVDAGRRSLSADRGVAHDRTTRRSPGPITLGVDKAYGSEDLVNELRSMNVTPYVAQNASGRSSAIDGLTTRHAGYGLSQRIRKRIEEGFG